MTFTDNGLQLSQVDGDLNSCNALAMKLSGVTIALECCTGQDELSNAAFQGITQYSCWVTNGWQKLRWM